MRYLRVQLLMKPESMAHESLHHLVGCLVYPVVIQFVQFPVSRVIGTLRTSLLGGVIEHLNRIYSFNLGGRHEVFDAIAGG